MTYEHILVERRDSVGLVTLNRPKALNALSNALMEELGEALCELEQDDAIGAIVLTGSDKAFAAGADIRDMQGRTATELFLADYPFGEGSGWGCVNTLRKPIVAAVAGLALGGGCELAMACDFIIAADNARFGQPEIRLGTLPGAGGTQRLTRAVGKSRAMDMILTGRFMEAEEAERAGLVSRVVPLAGLVDEAVKVAQTIAGYSRPAVMAAKECVNAAFEVPLREGLRVERRAFQASFASEDAREGTAAFLEKREAKFENR
jgi:enoyl-CoA hydratase